MKYHEIITIKGSKPIVVICSDKPFSTSLVLKYIKGGEMQNASEQSSSTSFVICNLAIRLTLMPFSRYLAIIRVIRSLKSFNEPSNSEPDR